MLYLIVNPHQILPLGCFLTVYKSIQKIRFHQKNLLKTQLCQWPSIPYHKKPLKSHLVALPHQRIALTWPQMDAHAWVCYVQTHAHTLNHRISFVHQWSGIAKSRIIFRCSFVALRRRRLTLINLHRLRDSLVTFCNDTLMLWGSLHVGRLSYLRVFSLSKQSSGNKQTQRLSCDRVNSTMAADMSCRCPAKMKDSATNAVNKLGMGWYGGIVWGGVQQNAAVTGHR